MSEEVFVDVSDVKQYFYCPRIVYFNKVLNLRERLTESMRAGKESHEEIKFREEKKVRLLSTAILAEEKLFGIYVESKRLKLRGVIDCLAKLPTGEWVVVEYKDTYSTRLQSHHYYQLVAYSLLAQEYLKRIVSRGFLFYALSRKIFEVAVTDEAKQYVRSVLRKILRIIVYEELPKPTGDKAKCRSCGYYRFCYRT